MLIFDIIRNACAAIKQLKKYFFLFILLSGLKTYATHIVGGEVYYDDLGNDQYKIHMKVYRDCFNGIPPFDGLPDANGNIVPPYFTIYDANGNVIAFHQFPAPAHNNIPLTINNPCVGVPNNVCVEVGIYEMTVTLPPKVGGYYIAYQRCCRNGTILNLVSPGSVGATYWEHIPGPEVVAHNSCPRFNMLPPVYICNGRAINFDHSATDPDGDSLVYSLCTPFDGLTSACPTVNNGQTGCPTVNTPPPYTPVPFNSSYNASYPMASNPAININSVTGHLDGVPTINGQWVVGVCVSEYRHGVLIGVHHRDFQFNVTPCPYVLISNIVDQSATQLCEGTTISFSNGSSSPTNSIFGYFWDFGDPNSTTDTSSQVNPTYTYQDTGTYTITLIANPHFPCSDTSRKVFHVKPKLQPDFAIPAAQCLDNNSFNFFAGGVFTGGGTYTWYFDSGVPSPSHAENPAGVHFTTPGFHNVKLVINENGCKDSVFHPIKVYTMPKSLFNVDSVRGCDPLTVTFTNNSTAETPLSFLWIFSDGQTSTDKNPTHIFTPAGLYGVKLIAHADSGCVYTDTLNAGNIIRVLPVPHAAFYANPTEVSIFDADINFYDESVNGISWSYNFGDGETSTLVNPFHHYTHWGDFTVKQTVTNSYGCPNTAEILIRIIPEFRFWVPNSFTPGNHDGLNDVFKPVVIGVDDYIFMVFNRWGELIYKTNDTEAGWPGTYKGKDSPIDVYVWKCTFTNVVSKEPEEHVGHVTLLR